MMIMYRMPWLFLIGFGLEQLNGAVSPPAARTSGKAVVDQVVAEVQKIFGDDKCFLRRIALVESKFGTDSGTYRSGYYGGIWQIDKIGFLDTQNVASHPNLQTKYNAISSALGIDWPSVKWEDLVEPLKSGLAARLFLLNIPEALPASLSGQGDYWKKHYNRNGKGSSDKFTTDVQQLENEGDCLGTTKTATKAEFSGCLKYMQDGDCEYYIECIDKYLSCKADDYPRAYAYKYCKKFKESEHLMDAKGVVWSKEVRPCLMKALYQRRHIKGMTCEKLGNIAFHSHVECYIESGDGFCDMISSQTNYDVMYDALEFMDFGSMSHGKMFRSQMIKIFNYCNSVSWNPSSKLVSFVSFMVNLASSEGQRNAATAPNEVLVKSAADAGDCKFYEYFEDKFECDKTEFKFISQVELPLCMKGLDKLGLMKTESGKAWFFRFQSCVMNKMMELYNKDAISCASLQVSVGKYKLDCEASTDMAAILKDNLHALDTWTETFSFPYILGSDSYRKPLSGQVVPLGPLYFESASAMKYSFQVAGEHGVKESAAIAVGDLKDNFPPADKAVGPEVVDSVVIAIKRSGIFPDDKCFLRRVAAAESNMGNDADTYRAGFYGGIWQITEEQFVKTQNSRVYRSLVTKMEKIQTYFKTDWSQMTWDKLAQPLYSGLAARLYISLVSAAIPEDSDSQAAYWSNHYHEGGDVQGFKASLLANEGADDCDKTSPTETGTTVPVPAGSCLCTTQGVNIREGPSVTKKKVIAAVKGDCFRYRDAEVKADGYTWKKVDRQCKEVWIAGSFLEEAESSKCATGITTPLAADVCVCVTKDNVETVRDSAGCSSSRLADLYSTECYNTTGQTKTVHGELWIEVNYFRKTAWIRGNILKQGETRLCSRNCDLGDDVRLDYDTAMKLLEAEDLGETNRPGKYAREAKGTTALDNIRCESIKGIIWFKKKLRAANHTCPVVITGGTEIGHSRKSSFSHYNGYKLDIRYRDTAACVSTFIESEAKKPKSSNPVLVNHGTKSNGWKMYKDTNGYIYTKETTKFPHWDIKFNKG